MAGNFPGLVMLYKGQKMVCSRDQQGADITTLDVLLCVMFVSKLETNYVMAMLESSENHLIFKTLIVLYEN